MMEARQNFNRSDFVLVLFPHTDLVTAKTRPALVVQADDLATDLSQTIVAMLTSKTFRANHPSRVLVSTESTEGQGSGLLSNSVVMTDNLATIANSEIDRKVGSIPMQRIDDALRITLGLQ